MEHFVRIVMEKQESAKQLDESIFPGTDLYESEQGATVYQIPLPRQLSEEESDEEEDLSDESVLARHQIVLDRMKEKLSAILEARKKQQDRKKTKK